MCDHFLSLFCLVSSLSYIFNAGGLENVSGGGAHILGKEYTIPDIVTPPPHNLGKLY